MKLRHHSLAALLALAAPAILQADTVYFASPDGGRIESISGTIVQQTSDVLEIETEDGRRVSIRKADVFQIIHHAPSLTTGRSDPDLRASRPSRARPFGLKGGMNVSNMSADPSELEDGDSLRSFAVGAWYGFPLHRRLTALTEVLYSVKGDAESFGGYTASTRITYLDVPVLAKIGFLHGAPVHPSLLLGPSLALNLSAHSKLEGDGGEVDDVDIKDQVRTFDVGLVFGGGVDFAVGERTCGVELRYSKGLSNAVGEDANGNARNDVMAVLGSIALQ